MTSINRVLGRLASFAPFIIRVVLGSLFILHGFDKFDTGISNVEGFFMSEGVPLAGFTAPLTAILEIVLGFTLVAGLATRISALALAAIMVGAVIWVKGPDILGSAELEYAYLSGLIALALLGPGRLSIDEALNTDETVIDLRSTNDAPSGSRTAVSA